MTQQNTTLVNKINALSKKADIAKSEGDRDAYEYFVDQMIILENTHFDNIANAEGGAQ